MNEQNMAPAVQSLPTAIKVSLALSIFSTLVGVFVLNPPPAPPIRPENPPPGEVGVRVGVLVATVGVFVGVFAAVVFGSVTRGTGVSVVGACVVVTAVVFGSVTRGTGVSVVGGIVGIDVEHGGYKQPARLRISCCCRCT